MQECPRPCPHTVLVLIFAGFCWVKMTSDCNFSLHFSHYKWGWTSFHTRKSNEFFRELWSHPLPIFHWISHFLYWFVVVLYIEKSRRLCAIYICKYLFHNWSFVDFVYVFSQGSCMLFTCTRVGSIWKCGFCMGSSTWSAPHSKILYV